MPLKVVLPAIAMIAIAGVRAGAQTTPEHSVIPLRQMPAQGTGTWIERVSGDPSAPSVPFVFRIHNEAGYVVLPHVHPMDENIVVVKGQWSLGMGRRFARNGLTTMDVGTFGFVRKTMAHFAWARVETIIQVHGIGPFVSTLVDSVYELGPDGILARLSLLQPGVITSSPPPGCFALKLGEPARTSRDEGVIIGAQCSPANQFTQYRIRRGDGTLFWAAAGELQTR